MPIRYVLADFTNTDTMEKLYGIKIIDTTFLHKDSELYLNSDEKAIKKIVKKLNDAPNSEREEIINKLLAEIKA